MQTSCIRYYLIFIVALISFISVTTGCSSFQASRIIENDSVAPMVYVGRCNFQMNKESCGELTRNIIFQASDDLLSFTDNWAIGRIGNYKIYMSCFSPGDESFIDGSFSSLTVVVAGPELKKTYETSKQLMMDFSDLLSEQNGDISHCLENRP